MWPLSPWDKPPRLGGRGPPRRQRQHPSDLGPLFRLPTRQPPKLGGACVPLRPWARPREPERRKVARFNHLPVATEQRCHPVGFVPPPGLLPRALRWGAADRPSAPLCVERPELRGFSWPWWGHLWLAAAPPEGSAVTSVPHRPSSLGLGGCQGLRRPRCACACSGEARRPAKVGRLAPSLPASPLPPLGPVTVICQVTSPQRTAGSSLRWSYVRGMVPPISIIPNANSFDSRPQRLPHLLGSQCP